MDPNFQSEYRLFKAIYPDGRQRLHRALKRITFENVLERLRRLAILTVFLGAAFLLIFPPGNKTIPLAIVAGYVVALNVQMVRFYVRSIRMRWVG